MASRAGKGLLAALPHIGHVMHEKRYRPVSKEVERARFHDAAIHRSHSLNYGVKLRRQKGVRSHKRRTLAKDSISRVPRNPNFVGLTSFDVKTLEGSHGAIRNRES